MKIICTQENLKAGLQIATRIIGNTNTLPILNNILLKTENGSLTLLSTNLEIGLRTEVRCKIEEPGDVCLPAKIINELISALPSGNIELSTTEHGVEIKAENYKTKIHSLPSDEFPLIPAIEKIDVIKINGVELKQAIDSVLFAASTNETQPEIAGVLFKQDGHGVRLVATDRYRLAEKKIPLTNQIEREIIIPHRTVQEISRVLTPQTEVVEVVIAETQIALFLNNTEIVSRLVDGDYPEYQAIIPQTVNTTIEVDTMAFVSALKTSGIFSKSTNSVNLSYNTENQSLKISAESHDLGESSIVVPAEVGGASGEILLNHKYVIDALQTIDKPVVVVKVVDEDSPVVFNPQGDASYLYLVMPIKN